jgi:hypothetical protein
MMTLINWNFPTQVAPLLAMEEDYSPQDGEFGFNIYNKF